MFRSRWINTRSSVLLICGLLMFTAATAQEKTEGQAESAEQDQAQMLELWTPGDSGQRMRIRGRVTDATGKPLPNVSIRVRHADSEGVDRSYHQGTVTTNNRGTYQFGSVIPGNSHRLSHVHVYISHDGFEYVDTEFYFKDDPKANPDDPNAIFLEEGNINGEKMMYGRWDIALKPE